MPYKDPEVAREYRRRYYLANREKKLAYQKEYVRDHPEVRLESRKKHKNKWDKTYYQKHKTKMNDKTRAGHLRRNYGLTPDEFDKQLELQEYRCGLCREPFEDDSKAKTPHVDHNHTTGRVRALLCHNCNAGLGHFKENPVLLVSALAYLEAWK